MKMDRNKIYSILTTVFLLILVYSLSIFFDYSCDLRQGVIGLTIFCILMYIWLLVSSYRIAKGINIYFALIILTIPFYLGDQLALLLGFEELMMQSDHSILDGIISDKVIFQAMFFLMESLLCLHLGYLIAYKSKKNKELYEQKRECVNIRQIKSMKYIGWVFYVLTIIPTIVIRLYDIYMSILLGHLDYRLSGGATGIFYYFDYLADWFVPACFILLIFADKKLEKNFATISIIIYCVLYLLSGKRMEIVGFVFATVCIFIYWYKIKISYKKAIKYCIWGILAIFVFQIVGVARNNAGGLNMFSADTIAEILGGSFIYGILETTGNTFTSIANTIRCVPEYLDFNYGKSILGSILYILPSTLREPYLSSIVTHISAVLSPYYYGWNISGYGSSFITEAFFNYGYFGVIIIAIYGIVVGKVINSIENVNLKKPFEFYLAIYMCLEIANGVRNDLYFIPRHIVLYVLLPYLLSVLLRKSRIRYK